MGYLRNWIVASTIEKSERDQSDFCNWDIMFFNEQVLIMQW